MGRVGRARRTSSSARWRPANRITWRPRARRGRAHPARARRPGRGVRGFGAPIALAGEAGILSWSIPPWRSTAESCWRPAAEPTPAAPSTSCSGRLALPSGFISYWGIPLRVVLAALGRVRARGCDQGEMETRWQTRPSRMWRGTLKRRPISSTRWAPGRRCLRAHARRRGARCGRAASGGRRAGPAGARRLPLGWRDSLGQRSRNALRRLGLT